MQQIEGERKHFSPLKPSDSMDSLPVFHFSLPHTLPSLLSDHPQFGSMKSNARSRSRVRRKAIIQVKSGESELLTLCLAFSFSFISFSSIYFSFIYFSFPLSPSLLAPKDTLSESLFREGESIDVYCKSFPLDHSNKIHGLSCHYFTQPLSLSLWLSLSLALSLSLSVFHPHLMERR